MKSMTGYGRAKIENDTREYIVEVKSVNHKYLDINIKLPKTLFCIEDKIRKVISIQALRENLNIPGGEERFAVVYHIKQTELEQLKSDIKEIEEIATENNIASGIRATEISKFPEVLNVIVDEEDEEKIWLELNKCLEKALDNFIEMRITEGEKIKEDLKQRLDEIDENINEIFKNSTGLVEEYVVKLRKRIQEILNTDVVDETRLAQEIVIYSDKTSIEEEITRIKSHIIQFKELLNSEGAIGKKADFIIQEMNREINTIGSKSGKFEITQLVIKIKTQIEDIREQIQNIE